MRYCLLSLFVLLLTFSAEHAEAYSVLTHEEVIDLTWNDSIRPLLLARYPNLTPAQLREAHAYAYGGCVIQDLGYYPFGQPHFSALLHYVRTGDFIRALFRNSQSADDLAFSIGALSHYLGDTIGHADAVNPAVGRAFPELAAKYGPDVNYAEGEHQHVRVEFAFDVNDIAKHRLPPERYLDHIGFEVAVPLLRRAFYETYGINLGKALHQSHPTFHMYHYSVRTLLPRIAYAESVLNRKRFLPDTQSPELDQLNQEIAALAAQDNWQSYRRRAGVGTHLLAGIILVVPKIGPLSDLSLRIPTQSDEEGYVSSLMRTTSALRAILAHVKEGDGLENLDLDTGLAVSPGTYSLEDFTYAQLLHDITRDPNTSIPFGIKRDLLTYFANPEKARYLKRKPALQNDVRLDLPILASMPTKAANPNGPILPAVVAAAQAEGVH